MSIKERPLIKSVERLSPLPGFLFANMVVAGFFAMLMCPVFGAVFAMFWGSVGSGSDTLGLFYFVHSGAIAGLIAGALVFVGIAVSAFREPEERAPRMQFFYGGVITAGLLFVVDMLAFDLMVEYFRDAGPLACTSASPGCDR